MHDDFWSAAASLAGRLHFPALRELLRREGLPPRLPALLDAGLPLEPARLLAQPPPAPGCQPYLHLLDERWPGSLDHAHRAPGVLYYQGRIALLRAPRIAIVGSRRCSTDGERMARRLARAVADRGGVVVSGLAHGIDEAAHLAADGRTIAVLGQGLGRPLTHRQQRTLDQLLTAGGLVLSEFLPTTPATRWTFPQRNRIIAGLGAATVVVQAARNSGALITARAALEQGRDVLAVPGSPLDPSHEGCLDLIAAGAGLARDGQDLAPWLPAGRPPSDPARATDLDPALVALLQRGADIDQISVQLELGLGPATALLSALELTGRVQRLPGDRFVLAREG